MMLLHGEYSKNKNNKHVRNLTKSFTGKKIWLLLLILGFLFVMLVKKDQQFDPILKETEQFREYDGAWRNLTKEEKARLSVLGRILYLEEERPPENKKNYTVLFWKYGNYIKNRHLNRYTQETFDPLDGCSVRNCRFSFNDNELNTADIVIFHLHRMKGLVDLPKKHDNPKQIWTFLTDESPYHTFLDSKVNISSFNGRFNWSMTYRMDSDIPVPYGRTRKFLEKIPLTTESNTIHKRKDILITILGSNCAGKNGRWKYVNRLKNVIKVDIFGGCGNKTACPGHFKSDCPAIDNYLFYLSFENSDCKEYITEKLFWNGYHKNSIPIVMGYDKKTYEKFLPPHSFLHVDDYGEPKDLANFILSLNATEEYKKYFEWKDSFEVVNEHGYFKSKSYHFCRICEAMNFNKKDHKVYNDITEFWSKNKDCSIR